MFFENESTKDLIDTYTRQMEVPIVLINFPGEIHCFEPDLSPRMNAEKIKEIVQIGQTLTTCTILTALDDTVGRGEYILSNRIYTQQEGDYFLLAGPLPQLLDKERKSTMVRKIINLSELLRTIISHGEQESFLNKMVAGQKNSLFNEMNDLSLDHIRVMGNLDFIGYAEKSFPDQYTINQIIGEKVESLKNETFYVGEGLLGYAAAKSKPDFWDYTIQSSQIDYFHNLGILPFQVFAFPIFKGDEVKGVLFGGQIKHVPIKSDVIHHVQSFAQQQSLINEVQYQIDNTKRSNHFLHLLIDILEVFFQSTNIDSFVYSVIYMCQKLNSRSFVCVSLLDKYYSRGEAMERVSQDHQDELHRYMGRTPNIIAESQIGTGAKGVMHLPVYWKEKRYGILTIYFPEEKTKDDYSLLTFMERLLGIKCALLELDRPIEEKNVPDSQLTGFVKEKVDTVGENAVDFEIENLANISDVIKQLPLTKREQEVLPLILDGLNNHEVGEYLCISSHTVKNHMSNIYRKLNVTDRLQVMAKIYRIKNGLE